MRSLQASRLRSGQVTFNDMNEQEIALNFLKKEWNALHSIEKAAIEKIVKRRPISRDTNQDFSGSRTFGEKIADSVAAFGGSWTFIIIFCGILLAWVILNSFILAQQGTAFDPYPYILLNLFLSMTAALQAPIIMMSQNRQSAKDRIDAAHDYEVNLKAELEICSLHQKIDELREKKWLELIEIQQKQIELLEKLLEKKK
jgi:uncharacterized membrane protein